VLLVEEEGEIHVGNAKLLFHVGYNVMLLGKEWENFLLLILILLDMRE
jgi:hypothetical protein